MYIADMVTSNPVYQIKPYYSIVKVTAPAYKGFAVQKFLASLEFGIRDKSQACQDQSLKAELSRLPLSSIGMFLSFFYLKRQNSRELWACHQLEVADLQ